jgi:exodeoxyribonuclease VII small subunit
MLNLRVMSATPAKKASTAEPNFEAAMDRLEAIVEEMESGKMQLEELIVRYEEGMKLVKTCQERLASAEQRIEIITRNHAGKPVVQPFEATSEPPRSATPAERKQNDEVRLF